MSKFTDKVKDGLILNAIWDKLMMKTRYSGKTTEFYYNVMIGQRHRMLFYKKFKKTLFPQVVQNRPWEQKEKKANPDTIWFCWMQGLEQAPEVVKLCYKSVCKIHGKKVVVLDESNIFEYADIPEFIVEKWRAGIIGYAHFTDIARLAILIRHGGYWIDSTVLCTDDRMLDLVDQTELFMYSFYYFGFNPEIMQLNNWFIYSTTYNNILCMEYELLLAYWKKYNRAVNYFFFQILMTLVVEYYKEEYRRMPIVSQVDAHVLSSYINRPFDPLKLDLLLQQTGIHKLSTRFDQRYLGEGTFYDLVIRKNCLKI